MPENKIDSTDQIYNFCTIFDSNYFSKGLSLYFSLERVCKFHLFIFTSEEKCFRLLEERNLINATIINIEKIEDEKLLEVKTSRNKGEYYWTIKSYCIEYLFKIFNLNMATYVDADTFFYSSPEPFFNELGSNSVLITPHNFSPKYKSEIKNGIYNAGYITFRNTEDGINALNWWKGKCTEWCFIKKEDGKFGDQLYLNELSQFKGIHILKHRGILANWNVQQYRFIKTGESIEGITHSNEKFKVVFYHFHYLKFYDSAEVELGRKYLSGEVFELFYKPYIRFLYESAPEDLQGSAKKPVNWKTPILYVKRKLNKTYNIIPLSNIIGS